MMPDISEYGLIGRGISHSFSADFFNDKFKKEDIKAEYLMFDLEEIDELPGIIRRHSLLKGLNVTSPYKRVVVPYLTELSIEAQELNAVNVIKICNRSGILKLKGFNTDCLGFRETIKGMLPKGSKAAVLGSGGASSAVCYALIEEGVHPQIVSRKEDKGNMNYAMFNETIPEFDIIINATPIGMYPHTVACPDVDFSKVRPGQIFYDLIYNPAQTIFLRKASEKGARIFNGLPMLKNQAMLSWEIWNSK